MSVDEEKDCTIRQRAFYFVKDGSLIPYTHRKSALVIVAQLFLTQHLSPAIQYLSLHPRLFIAFYPLLAVRLARPVIPTVRCLRSVARVWYYLGQLKKMF